MKLPPPLDWQIAKIGPGQEVLPKHRVTRENWRLYPYSRWAFQHTRELVPSRALCRSNAPRHLDENIVPLDDLCIASDGADGAISWAEFEAQTYTDAMLIIHNGAIIHERYSNGMTRHTPHHAFSVSKSFIGLLAEGMIADDLLDRGAAVTRYVPELVGSGFAGVGIHHLLDMTDGVAFDEDYANPGADVHRYSANYWTPALASGGVRAALARLTGRNHAPGSEFSYRTPVTDALGWVIARASGKRLADLFNERIWQPAGCADEGHFLVDTVGDEIAASGLNTTARDMARLALLVSEGTGIPAAARASILRGGNRDLFVKSKHNERSPGSYGSQWWVAHDDFGSISALGVFGQRVHIETETGLIMVRFGSHPLASNLHTDGLHRRALEALRNFLH